MRLSNGGKRENRQNYPTQQGVAVMGALSVKSWCAMVQPQVSQVWQPINIVSQDDRLSPHSVACSYTNYSLSLLKLRNRCCYSLWSWWWWWCPLKTMALNLSRSIDIASWTCLSEQIFLLNDTTSAFAKNYSSVSVEGVAPFKCYSDIFNGLSCKLCSLSLMIKNQFQRTCRRSIPTSAVHFHGLFNIRTASKF